MAETPPDRPRLRDFLEPGALNPGFPASEPDYAWEIEIEASKAISLKRIADALAAPDAGLSIGMNIGGGIEQIAFSIGQQIRRGHDAG